MEQYYIPIITALIIFFITGGFTILTKLIKKVINKLELACIKHDSLVTAWQKSTGNGFYEYYTDELKRLMEEKRFVEK